MRASVSRRRTNLNGLGPCGRLAPASNRSQDPIEHGVEIFRDILGEKADYEIAVLLQ